MATTSALLGQKSINNERFNAEAAGWDNNPFVHKATNAAYKALKENVPALQDADTSKSINVLEIGCGTGVLSLQIAKDVQTVVAVDAAQGMINVLKNKLETTPNAPKNVVPVCVLLEDPEDINLPPDQEKGGTATRTKFDLILSHLVLHHIPDLKPVLKTMLGCLKPDTGMVALTDFQDFGPQAKKFHPKSKMVGVERHGIDMDWIANLMTEIGFRDVDVRVGFRVEKEVERVEGEFGDKADGGELQEGQSEMMEFPFLVCMGKR